MLRKATARIAWVGRTASVVFGLALVLGLLFGVASMALGANGQALLLGKANVATAITKLTGDVNGSAMQVTNNNAGTDDSALSLNVQPGESPLKVNSGRKVTNLNADLLDGQDASTIGGENWAVVGSDGTLVRGHNAYGAPFTHRVGTGHYVVAFQDEVNDCAYAATTTNGLAGQTGVDNGSFTNWVTVYTVSSNGTSADMPFHVIVTC